MHITGARANNTLQVTSPPHPIGEPAKHSACEARLGMHIYRFMHACMYVCTPCMHVCTLAYTYIYIYMYMLLELRSLVQFVVLLDLWKKRTCPGFRLLKWTRIYTRRQAYICMHVCMYVRTHECMHVCMHVCTFAYIYIHIYIDSTWAPPPCWVRSSAQRVEK